MDKLNALSTGTTKGGVKCNETIETAQQGKPRGKGWAKDKCQQALIEASLYQFKNVVAPALSIPINCPTKPMSLAILEKIVGKNAISVPAIHNTQITQNIFTDDSKKKFLQHLSEVKQAGNQAISVEEVLNVIKNKKLHTDRVTDRNWRNFLECKKIDRDIFIAFCTILEINWPDVVECSPQPRNDLTKTTRLVQILDSFNHIAQTNIVCQNLSINSKAAFLVVNSCSYSRTLMIRRIEYEIRINSNREVQRESFLSQSRFPPSVENFNSLFSQRFSISKIEQTLREKYLFFIINIDNYDLDALCQLVENIWQPLLKKIYPENQGKILLFLVASDQGNNWQTEWNQHPILANSLAALPPAQFNVNDLSQFIPRVAMRLNIQLQQNVTNLSQEILANSGGSTEKLLRLFYQHFNCSPNDFKRQWQNYPPT
jgi:hypothetical protein